MENGKKSIYIESTIPSYATARESKDVIKAARQSITKLFWEQERYNYELVVSQYVIDECSLGDLGAAQKRLDFLSGEKPYELLQNKPKEDRKKKRDYKEESKPRQGGSSSSNIRGLGGLGF